MDGLYGLLHMHQIEDLARTSLVEGLTPQGTSVVGGTGAQLCLRELYIGYSGWYDILV